MGMSGEESEVHYRLYFGEEGHEKATNRCKSTERSRDRQRSIPGDDGHQVRVESREAK